MGKLLWSCSEYFRIARGYVGECFDESQTITTLNTKHEIKTLSRNFLQRFQTILVFNQKYSSSYALQSQGEKVNRIQQNTKSLGNAVIEQRMKVILVAQCKSAGDKYSIKSDSVAIHFPLPVWFFNFLNYNYFFVLLLRFSLTICFRAIPSALFITSSFFFSLSLFLSLFPFHFPVEFQLSFRINSFRAGKEFHWRSLNEIIELQLTKSIVKAAPNWISANTTFV